MSVRGWLASAILGNPDRSIGRANKQHSHTSETWEQFLWDSFRQVSIDLKRFYGKTTPNTASLTRLQNLERMLQDKKSKLELQNCLDAAHARLLAIREDTMLRKHPQKVQNEFMNRYHNVHSLKLWLAQGTQLENILASLEALLSQDDIEGTLFHAQGKLLATLPSLVAAA